jgi:Glyoxalase-like domain
VPQESRHYQRHWTPVHLDIQVDDLKGALAQALEAGALLERLFEGAGHGPGGILQ